ncbi:MAG TPA: thioesterase family protein [Aliidongia sp.]|uniref:acyl-CoA thioesterase n=1 Tax=Aliidongia sp. TaxID=1914230 RepID=UPI002DDD9E9D|nr:thioesterase family protein [Aliidongia sp.]HEV2675906.1 thioesterase family protein [Aliidongia sp.]
MSDLLDRSSFTYWHEDVLRFGDLDRQNHVNNVAFASFCENGRVRFFDTVVRPLIGWDDLFVLVRIVIDYRHEVHYPGSIEVGTRLMKLGRSSVTFGQGLFNNGRCVATSEAVVVLMDVTTRKSRPFPDHAASTLRALAESLPKAIEQTA